ncbi:MAG TPA: hypothetical protein VGN21_03980 [Stellaceae bacterium]|jgi:hypothetical protein
MNSERAWRRTELAAGAALITGIVGCAIGIAVSGASVYRAWLCAYLFWLGLPLGAATLVLVHDLTGGVWMASARPVLAAAAVTMPLVTLAGIPVLIGLRAIYPWPVTGSSNGWYLNTGFFILRYAIDFVVWNAAAAYALWAPRGLALGVPPGLRWASAVGLLLLAYTASFASIDWVLSLDPKFWSAIFPMILGAHWFNTGLAFVLIVVALSPAAVLERSHLRDLASILLATVIFWAYVEFCQFLIVWEENLSHEIPWYLRRIAEGWRGVTWFIAIAGFFAPFALLLFDKRSRPAVIAAAVLILLSRLAESAWLVAPDLPVAPPLWLVAAAVLALGGLMSLLFLRRLRYGPLPLAFGPAR